MQSGVSHLSGPGPVVPSLRLVHELVLDEEGAPLSLRGSEKESQQAVVPERINGLDVIARRAGRIPTMVECSFFWRAADGGQIFATVRSRGLRGRTSLTWIEGAEVPYGLTARELDVLTLLVGGLSNPEIAARLWTSPRTISTHVERILAKVGVASRAAAATVAQEESLLVLPVPGGADGFERLLMGVLSMPEPDDVPQHRSERTLPGPVTRRRSLRRPVILGGAFPLTGETAEDGEEMVRATRLAVDEVNRRGGIAGRPVDVVAVDVDINDPVSIRAAFTELAEHDVDAMVSGYLGDQAVAHEVAADHGAPYLHAATLESMVRLVGDNPSRYGNVFQVCPSDTNYGPGFVRTLTYLRDSGQLNTASRSLAIVRGRWKLGDLAIPESVDLAEGLGWRVDYVADDVHGDEEWEYHAEQVASLAPAAVLIGSYFVHETVAFVQAFLADPSPTVLYSLYAPSIPQFRLTMGPQAEGILWATTTGTYSDQLARDFIGRYRDA